MTPRRLLPALAAALLLAACSAASDDGFSSSAPAQGDLFAFSASGIGGFAPETPYSARAVEAALPGFTASDIEMATEQRTLTGIGVFKDGLQVLQLVPAGGGRIAAVHGVSTRVRGPNGERIGMTLPQARVSRADCREGTGNWRGMPLCAARGAPGVTLVFAIPGYAEEGLPDDALLGEATLQRIVWDVPGGPS